MRVLLDGHVSNNEVDSGIVVLQVVYVRVHNKIALSVEIHILTIIEIHTIRKNKLRKRLIFIYYSIVDWILQDVKRAKKEMEVIADMDSYFNYIQQKVLVENLENFI